MLVYLALFWSSRFSVAARAKLNQVTLYHRSLRAVVQTSLSFLTVLLSLLWLLQLYRSRSLSAICLTLFSGWDWGWLWMHCYISAVIFCPLAYTGGIPECSVLHPRLGESRNEQKVGITGLSRVCETKKWEASAQLDQRSTEAWPLCL